MEQLNIVVDHTRAAPGIVTSYRAAEMLRFIESCGGVAEDALALIFRKNRQLLAKLRGAGMIYRVKCGERVIWVPIDIPPPSNEDVFIQKDAVGWLAVRLVEVNGSFQKGMAVFPNNAAFRVITVPPASAALEPCLAIFLKNEKVPLCKGSIWVRLVDLQRQNIKECLQSIN
ncbi:hypothetical protein [Desulfoscipio gibsoniae]